MITWVKGRLELSRVLVTKGKNYYSKLGSKLAAVAADALIGPLKCKSL